MISQKFWLRTWKCKSLISSSRFRFSIQTLSKMMSNVRQFLFNFQEVSFWNWCSWVNGKTAARSSVLIRFKTFVCFGDLQWKGLQSFLISKFELQIRWKLLPPNISSNSNRKIYWKIKNLLFGLSEKQGVRTLIKPQLTVKICAALTTSVTAGRAPDSGALLKAPIRLDEILVD